MDVGLIWMRKKFPVMRAPGPLRVDVPYPAAGAENVLNVYAKMRNALVR